jgi:outer membrane protein TolC
MSTKGWWRSLAVLTAMGLGVHGVAGAALTADEAVKVALRTNTQIINARAGILDARSGMLGAWSALLPSLSVAGVKSESQTEDASSANYFGGTVFQDPLSDSRSRSSSLQFSTSIGVLDLSNWADFGAARQSVRAARWTLDATRNDVALETRRLFYGVVTAIKLAEVASGALKRSRDDERRVNAMFQVGSVSKSDLLKAQVATAQSELDSITARHAITTQRIALANQMGIAEGQLGEVDTVLTAQTQSFAEDAILAEAQRVRPDLTAAEAELRAARGAHTAARLARLPYVTASGSASYDEKSNTRVVPEIDQVSRFSSGSDQRLSGTVALRWDVFNLAAIDARIASARARADRAQGTRDALVRNLAAEVHQALLTHNEAVTQNGVAQRGLESATENMKLTQEKYNVGSATILELIDAQVQLQTAQSNVVRALAAIRVAEAQINRVRGRSE